MISHVCLLDSEIYEIQEAWTGWDNLWYANNALRTSAKGLQFFCPMSPLEFPKFMGLTGVHNPNTLHHFASITFCSWWRKEGQNKGTIIKHLWTMHYNLKLVYEKCLHCPSITSEGIWHHGQSCKWPKGKTEASMTPPCQPNPP